MEKNKEEVTEEEVITDDLEEDETQDRFAHDVPEKTSELTEDVLADIRELREKVKELESVADKGRLDTLRSKKKVKVPYIVDLTTLGGKIVVAWRTVEDEVYQDSNSVFHERQVIELTTEDGKKHIMPLIDRYRVTQKVPATIVSRSKDNEGEDGDELHEIFKLKLEDGREIEIDGKFIN